jgi:hypothetical protein
LLYRTYVFIQRGWDRRKGEANEKGRKRGIKKRKKGEENEKSTLFSMTMNHELVNRAV